MLSTEARTRNRVRSALQERGITHRSFSERLGVPLRGAYKFSDPGIDLRASTLARIASAIGCSVSDLVSEPVA